MTMHILVIILWLYGGIFAKGEDIKSDLNCQEEFGGRRFIKGKFEVKTEKSNGKKLSLHTRDLKDSFTRHQRRYVKCRSTSPFKITEKYPNIITNLLLKPKNIQLNSLEGISVKESCFASNQNIENFYIGYLDEYEPDEKLRFQFVKASLRWDETQREGTVELLGKFSFCNKGQFKYFISPQNNSITTLKAHSTSPISYKTLATAYPGLKKYGGLLLWEQVYSKLRMIESLTLEKVKWYTLWRKSDTTTFFKSTWTARTEMHQQAFGDHAAKKEKLTFNNFEAISNYESTLNVHYLNFDMDLRGLVQLLLHSNALEALNKVFPLNDLEKFIKISQQVYLVGVSGTLQPNQFDDFYLLSRKRNFLPFYIFGGTMKNEFYLQAFGNILNGMDEKPVWLDAGTIHIYVREFKSEDTITFFIEFQMRQENCKQKKISDFDGFTKKFEAMGMFEKEELEDTSCLECCQVVPSLKYITIVTSKNFASMNKSKWRIDIQLRSRQKLIWWKLKPNRKVQFENFL